MNGEGEDFEGLNQAAEGLGDAADQARDAVTGLGDDAREAVSGLGDDAREAVGGLGDQAHEAYENLTGQDSLDLNEDDRLPWLESAEDDYDDAGVDGARIFGFVLAGLLALALLVGGLWWFTHRKPDPALVADGATVPAPSEPYKELPKDPGGKTFAGTGDTSFAVSEGQSRQAQVAGGNGAAAAPKPSIDVGAKPVAGGTVAGGSATGAAAAPAGGVGVQVGAYGSQAAAEAGWSRLAGSSALLKGVAHRVVEGNADIGKVYRLQAVPGDAAAADALCAKLKAAGTSCQVKR